DHRALGACVNRIHVVRLHRRSDYRDGRMGRFGDPSRGATGAASVMAPTDEACRVLVDAQRARIFPCAVAEAGDSTAASWHERVGTLTFDAAASVEADTPFDLASLTKVIATTTLAMQLAEAGTLALDTLVATLFGEWRGSDREGTSVRDLLEHASGLPARLVDAPPRGRREFEHEICTIRLEYEPRSRSIYSDLGFILLGFAIADAIG